MNAIQGPTAVDQSRRRFLSRLFQPDSVAETGLQPVALPGSRSQSVLWAIEADDRGGVYAAGDDGRIFYREQGDWVQETCDSGHNIHALCHFQERLYAVGWMGQICVRQAGQWQALQGGGDGAEKTNYPLFDIAADDEGPWAVGDHGRITRWVDGAWQEQPSVTTANLRCVLPLGGGRVLAAGLGGVLLERAGDRWRQLETGTGCALVSIAQLSEDVFVLAGGEYSVADGQFVGRLFLLSEGEFTEVETPVRLPRLRRVRRQGEQLIVVGDAGTAYRWTATGVTPIATQARYDLHDVLPQDDGSLLVCGDGEVLLEEAALGPGEALAVAPARQWETLAQMPGGGTLRALLAPAPGELIAAGDGGQVLHLCGEELVYKTIPGNLSVHALWCSSPRNVLAACEAASIAHYDGDSWSLVHRGEQDVPFLALTGFGPHDIFAVGDAGLAVRFDGLMWRQLETGTRQELYGLWGQDSDHLLAVGGGGLVLRFDGQQWKTFTAGTEQDLYAVHGRGLQKLFLAGLAGTLIRFENNAWHREFSGTRADLHAIASDTSGTVFVAGSNGTILAQRGQHWAQENTGITATLQALLCCGGESYAAGAGGVLLKRN